MSRAHDSRVLPDVKRSRKNLALLLRESFHENLIRDWFLMILSGRNPVMVEDKRRVEQGCLKVVPDVNDLMVPTAERRDQAMRALLDRRDGLPAQRVHLQAEINSTQKTMVIGASELATLGPQALTALAQTLRSAMLAPPRILELTSAAAVESETPVVPVDGGAC